MCQRSVADKNGRKGQAIPSTDPKIALVLWDGKEDLAEVPADELTFISD